jgi:hypothetical protein
MNVVSGRVLLQENGVGLSGLLVVVHDLSAASLPAVEPVTAGPATAGSSAHAAPAAAEAVAVTGAVAAAGDGAPAAAGVMLPIVLTPSVPLSLGSQLTDSEGAFAIEYDDALLQTGAALRRPTISVSVMAPEGPGGSDTSRILYESPTPRVNASPSEEFVIAVPTATLTAAGIPFPLDPSVASQRSQAVIQDMQQMLAYHTAVTGGQQTLATQQVSAVRTAAQAVDAAAESSLLAALSTVSAADAARFNVVPPGAPVEQTVWPTVSNTIEQTVNNSSRAGYVILSPDEAKQFQNPDGTYKQDIPAAEIEPYIFQADDAQRPITILRSDAATARCRAQVAANPFDPATTAPTTAPSAANGAGTSADAALTAADLPKFVGRLVAPIVAPEEVGTTIEARPTVADVQGSVGALQLNGGPADVTAYYDFHQFQIAFDYVWQQAIDSGVIETGKQLCRQLADRGGDPTGALNGAADPIAALRNEVRHVAVAQESLQGSGVAYRLAQNGGSNGSASTPPPPPPSPQLPKFVPPIVRPPFVGVNAVGGDSTSAEPGDLLTELESLLAERYSFEVFAPGSTNFGLVITYRQRWDPITYQVGDLVKTLTLAPKETRKVTSKRTLKVDRTTKQMEDNQSDRKDESSQTMRDEAEIVQKAQQKTSFSTNAAGSFQIGIWSGNADTKFQHDAESASQETKKDFHESVLKAAQEYKDERKLEVEAKFSSEEETTDSVEISNPNDELTVTYLFYELQRRYRVSEHIHKLTPVVLVALDVPNPNRDEIDMVLLSQSWVINRVLLDDRYREPLEYMRTRIVGDEMALADLETNVEQVQLAVAQLQQMERDMQVELTAREAAFEAATQARAGAVASGDNQGWFSEVVDDISGATWQKGMDPQQAQILEESAKDAYDRAVQAEKDLRMRLDAETAALSAATDAYAKARAEHGNHLLQIAALRTHFKENVLYYMQAIWSYTFSDELFFSLVNLKVPKLTATQKTYNLKVPDQVPLSLTPKPGQVVLEVDVDLQLQTSLDPLTDFVTLAEVADLDNPLGFKGNYIIYPLRQSNPLTDFMMLPYVDSELGIHDPDELGSWTPEDFSQYASCLLQQEKDQLSESDYAALQSQLETQYQRIVTNPAPTTDIVVVPTSSLYIEALPGAHPLLENFKLEHRAIDVQKAKGEARKQELENLRYAARILGSELGDPDFDKQVLVTGASGVDVADQ